MIVKNNFFKNFVEDLTEYNGFLIYGPDKGQVKERSNIIIERLKEEKGLNVLKVTQEDLEKNSLTDLIHQQDIFSNKSIIIIDLEFFSNLKLDEIFFQSILSGNVNYIMLEGGNLKKNDIIVKNFTDQKKLACIPCYHDTDSSIKQTIKDYSKKFNLDIDESSVDYLANKLGSDKLITLQEIKKLSIYGNGKHVTYDEVLHAVGDSSLININKICDHLFNSDKAPYFYEKIIEAGQNNIVVIRSLLNHFYFLLNFKEDTLNNNIKLPASIHFSRHTLIQNQIKLLSKEKIKKIIANIYELEKMTKKEYSLSELIIKKFLLHYSSI
ncbi:MAG: DNA polymerase III subunit delta [Pelagibacterales bacterium]|nr:DNA polymerase III subunit delta [Pelagibacterales bacterium]